MEQDEYQQLLEKYKSRIKEEFGEAPLREPKITTKEYTEFKRELYPAHYSFYEKACNFSENLLKIKPDPKKALATEKNIVLCHLNVTPSGVLSFAILASLCIIVFGSLITFALPTLFGLPPMTFLVFFSIITGLILIPVLQKVPTFMANTWRMKASNQMVQSIFYMVTYMRHTSPANIIRPPAYDLSCFLFHHRRSYPHSRAAESAGLHGQYVAHESIQPNGAKHFLYGYVHAAYV